MTPSLASGAGWHGEEVALWVPPPPPTHRTPPSSDSLLLDPSIIPYSGPSLGTDLWETMGTFWH